MAQVYYFVLYTLILYSVIYWKGNIFKLHKI